MTAQAMLDLSGGMQEAKETEEVHALERAGANLLAEAYGERDRRVALALENLACDEGTAALPEAIDTFDRAERAYGDDRPAAEQACRGVTLIYLGQPAKGLALLEVSLTALAKEMPGHRLLFGRRSLYALALVRERRYAEARAVLDAVLTESAAQSASHHPIPHALSTDILLRARMGRAADALARFPGAMEALAKERADLGVYAIPARLGAAEAKLAQKDFAGAIASAESALACVGNGSDPVIVADVEIALARALVASGGDESRARALRDKAAGDYARGGRPELAPPEAAVLARDR
jgi:hypothetical protein